MSTKILCCIFNYPSHYRKSIYLELSKNFKTHFYFGNKLNNNERIEKIKVHEIPNFMAELKVVHFKLLFNWEFMIGMIKLAFIKQYKQYIITPNFFAINQWIFIICCWIMGKEVYTWEHGVKEQKIRKIWLIQRKFFYFFIKGAFLYGQKAKRNMIEKGFSESKLNVVYNSLNYNESFQLRIGIKTTPIYFNYFGNSDPVLVFIGRLTKIKKLDLLIWAHMQLFNKGIECNVVLIGDGELSSELSKKIDVLQLSKRYWFLGSIYDEVKISELLYNADICVSPGNVGLTAIHAFSYGIPVITNDNFDSQMPEHEIIEQNLTGMFFEEDNVESLVSCIEWWIENKNNKDEIRKLCFQKVDHFYNHNTQLKIIKQILLR
jgi:glycosyltransferase involved in cell wall biosynthesis